MSRIILSRYKDGQQRLVVGYDHTTPTPGCFWAEWRAEDNASTRKPQVLRSGGDLMEGIPIGALIDSMPEDLRGYVTAEVIELLAQHEGDPESWAARSTIDLSGEPAPGGSLTVATDPPVDPERAADAIGDLLDRDPRPNVGEGAEF